MKPLFLTIGLLGVLLLFVQATPPHPDRNLRIPARPGWYQLDTLSIIAESFSITGPDRKPLDEAFYELDPFRARLRLRTPEFWHHDSLGVSYSVWPVFFPEPVFLRDTSLIRLPGPGEEAPRIALRQSPTQPGLLQFEGLQSSGSITRGLTLGNRQDASLSSAMNLQLNGRLTDDIEILAVVSDQNIPFQPDGTTQQIQDFDKVFIQLSGHGARLTAGDFELQHTPGHFSNLNRKARGASISYTSDTLITGIDRVHTTLAGAISRGKYARNTLQGMEGNQGPYRLRGNDNESFIIVLAGTERVFLDGILLTRGMENDYVMDYNLAEITFMPRRLITRDSRIVVEFEYAERNYARSMLYTSTGLQTSLGQLHVSFFSEQDHPNQPLFQEISAERRARMAAVGNNIDRAFDWNLDSTGFKNDRVMYRLTDTLGFDSVFVFSTDPQVAVYQVGFSFVGEGNGNYRQVNTAANGRVYQWIAPVDGIPQGTHEPIVQLVTPKKHQLLNLGTQINISPHTTARLDYAFSNRDINLFSDLDKENNTGHAIFMTLSDQRRATPEQAESWLFTSRLSYEHTGAWFRAPERYREVEFERNWNLPFVQTAQPEHLPALSFTASHPQKGMARYILQGLLRGEEFRGLLNRLESRLSIARNTFEANASLLNSSGDRITEFYRHRLGYSYAFSIFQAGIIHQMEHNTLRQQKGSALAANSFFYEEREAFLASPAQAGNNWRLFYRQRHDHLPAGLNFQKASLAHDYGLQYNNRQNNHHRWSIQWVLRELEVEKERFPGEQNERTLNSRVDHFVRWGAITSTLFYQTASAMERKREYIYVEVPPGQGLYVWVDYNGNGVMELDEFELSPFPDEANFIRVFIPTDEFVRTYSTAISHSINLEPATLWRESEGVKKWMARFSNRLNYRIDKKNQGGLAAENLNPFFTHIDDTLLVSLNASVRNSLFFNRTHRVYSLEWTLQQNSSKNILSNGFESRQLQSHAVRGRINLSRQISLLLVWQTGRRINESEFFNRRNFNIRFQEIEPTLSYQPQQHLRFNLFYGYARQTNALEQGGEQSQTHKTGLETRLNFPGKGSLQTRYQVSEIRFPYDPNSPLAFDMLQALQPGTNHLWNINWQQNINAFLQLTLNYNGRKPPGIQAIHTGSVALRAFF